MIKEDFLKNYTELISSGSTPKGGNKVYLKDGKILFFRGQNILMNKFSDHDSVYISNEIHDRMKRTWVKKGDVLLVITGSIGRTAVYEGEDYTANVNQHVCIIRLKDFNVIDPYYLSYYLASPDMQRHIMRISIGATRAALNFSQIGKFKIPIPPIENQKKIVETLEKAEKLKEWRAKADKLADEYLKSVFLEMFGDPIKNTKNFDLDYLENSCTKITDGEHQNPKLAKQGNYLIMAKDVRKDFIDFSQNNYVSKNDFEKFIKKCEPERGDILLVSRGATIGRCTSVDVDTPFCLMGSVILIKPKNLSTDYLEYLFKHENFIKRIIKLSSASAQQAIYLKHLKKLKIPIPPEELQKQFSEQVSAVKYIKNSQSKSKQQIDNLFNTLMQKAFKGELIC